MPFIKFLLNILNFRIYDWFCADGSQLIILSKHKDLNLYFILHGQKRSSVYIAAM